MRRGNWFWGALLVLVGAVLLIDQFTAISFWQWFWPSLLILAGLWIMLGLAAGRRAVEREEVAVPLQGAARAKVELDHGAGRLRIEPGSAPGMLLSGSCGGGVELETAREGQLTRVHLRPPRGFFPIVVAPWSWGPGGALDWSLGLSPDLPLALELDIGAGEARLDLERLQVTELDLDTGASSVTVTLPAQAGHTRVEIDAGVASVSLRVPEGVAARIRVQAGLSGVSVDRRRFPRSGGIYQSPDYDTAANRAEISVETGVGSINIR